jgi:peroxiredoxin
MISKGEQFPSFSLENQDGNFISNETIKGRKTILYFYHCHLDFLKKKREIVHLY